MQTLKYTSRNWKIEARVQDAGDNKRLAVISEPNLEGDGSPESRPTVVFDHIPGCDEVEEMKAQLTARSSAAIDRCPYDKPEAIRELNASLFLEKYFAAVDWHSFDDAAKTGVAVRSRGHEGQGNSRKVDILKHIFCNN